MLSNELFLALFMLLDVTIAQYPTAWGVPTASTVAGAGRYWRGWNSVQKLFAFGDSYTSTLFNPAGPQPNPNDPLGNPPYWGSTSANGPNWIDYLTEAYNSSLVETYNFAYGGATINKALVPEIFWNYPPDFSEQVSGGFVAYYVRQDPARWTSANSLFAAWFGVNDITNTYTQENLTLVTAIIHSFSRVFDTLYKNGARNFLILNVPPVDRSPGTLSLGAQAQALEGAAIADFNDRLAAMADKARCTYRDVTIFLFDTNRLFSQVLVYPPSYDATAGYQNTTAYCAAYQNGTPGEDDLDTLCGVPVDEYFWLNSLHPTFPIHRLLAQQVALLLQGLNG